MARVSPHEVAAAVLRAAGVPFSVHVGRKHVKVRWELGGRAYSYSCAKTPSDRRATENLRCDVRRMLREAISPPLDNSPA